MEMYDIVSKLIGEIKPVGETNTDMQRFENLQAMITLVDSLLFDIGNIAVYKERPEHSMQKAGKIASEFFDQLGITE